MIKNLLDACGAGIAFVFFGYGIAYGGAGDDVSWSFVGNDHFFLTGSDLEPDFVFFQFAFCATAATIVAGTLAERCKMASYFAYRCVCNCVIMTQIQLGMSVSLACTVSFCRALSIPWSFMPFVSAMLEWKGSRNDVLSHSLACSAHTHTCRE
jgi:Ammonium Transporter Family